MEEIGHILGSMQDLCKSAIEKSQDNPSLYAQLSDLSDDIFGIQCSMQEPQE